MAENVKKVAVKEKKGFKSAFPQKEKKETPKLEVKSTKKSIEKRVAKPKPKKKVVKTPNKGIHEKGPKPKGMKMKQRPGKEFPKNSRVNRAAVAERDLGNNLKGYERKLKQLQKMDKSAARKKAAKALAASVKADVEKGRKGQQAARELPRGKPVKSNLRSSFDEAMHKGKKVLLESTGNIRKKFSGKKPTNTTQARGLIKVIGKHVTRLNAILRKLGPLSKVVPLMMVAEAAKGGAEAARDIGTRAGKAKFKREQKELSGR